MKNKLFLFLFLILSISLTSVCFAKNKTISNKPMTFSEAKRHLTKIYVQYINPNSLYPEAGQTFYCHCPIQKIKKTGKKKANYSLIPNLKSCNYKAGKFKKRAQVIEWEHIMPASWKGKNMNCWKKGGRKNCQGDPIFVKFEGDMHNLVPAIGEINAIRGQLRYDISTHKTISPYGQCNFIVNQTTKSVTPDEHTRGFIARTFLYMSEKHNVELSKSDLKLMQKWNKQYAPTQWECVRNEKISAITNVDNHYITKACKTNYKKSNGKHNKHK